eukprot:7208190-Prymnesium_polylepis.1
MRCQCDASTHLRQRERLVSPCGVGANGVEIRLELPHRAVDVDANDIHHVVARVARVQLGHGRI